MKKASLSTFLLLTTASFGFAADIVDTASSTGNFKTLVTLVQKAGLADTLKGTGPFTVFAPTDEAFAKLPKETLESLTADPEKLKSVLSYHVLNGKVMAADAKTGPIPTLNGQTAKITSGDGKVMINKATVVQADVACDNGVIHAIDTVILPRM